MSGIYRHSNILKIMTTNDISFSETKKLVDGLSSNSPHLLHSFNLSSIILSSKYFPNLPQSKDLKNFGSQDRFSYARKIAAEQARMNVDYFPPPPLLPRRHLN